MNAYELADDAKNIHTTIEALEFVQKAVPMLRQQADRIAELEKQGEPVAWMNGNEICPEIGYEATITIEHPKDLGWIPLYTTPQTKPLTDEEMKKLINNFPIIFSPQDLLSFARAIEERHGIK